MRGREICLGFLVGVLAGTASVQAQPIALHAAADTWVSEGTPNQNRGRDPNVQLSSGDSRILLRFDQAEMATAVGSGRLVSASLELFSLSSSRVWGADGRPVEAHRLTTAWTEAGATWNCAVDSKPANNLSDCATSWGRGPFVEESSDTPIQTSEEHRWLKLDVTTDVAAFLAGAPNQGWLLKKSAEDPGGPVSYGSREGTAAEQPRLVLTVESAAQDQVPPTLTIASPSRPILVNESSPAVEVEYSDGGSGVDATTLHILVDGQEIAASCTTGTRSASCHSPALTAGNHTIQARLRDLAGNAAEASFGFQLLLGAEIRLATLQAVEDTYLQKGEANRNRGSEPILRLQENGQGRVLVRFDSQNLSTTLAGATLVAAFLELHIESNGQNWGPSGRTVEARRLTLPWTELGATWSCSVDSSPSNQKPDCLAQWNGGSFASLATASVLHTRDLAGWVRFNVTADVAAFLARTENHGWLLRNTDERLSGRADYDSRQGTGSEGPRVVVVYETGDTTAPTVAITAPAEGSFVASSCPGIGEFPRSL